MNDISVELLEKIKELFNLNYDQSKKVGSALSLLEGGRATYADAQEYAIEVGEILANALGIITIDKLPNGKMYYNIAKKILEPTLINNYTLISDYCKQVQSNLNQLANIGLKSIASELNQDRIHGIAWKISQSDNFDDVKWLLNDPIIQFSQSVVDDTIKSNANLHYKAGKSPTIKRKVMGHACEWCMNLAGTYSYPDVPDNVYQRHRDCRCQVTYDPKDGSRKVQDVWSKEWDNEKLKKNSNEYADNRNLSKNKLSILMQQENVQNYRPIIRGDKVEVSYNSNITLNTKKVDSYKDYNIYISDKSSIKKRALHEIKNRTDDAIQKWGIKKKPNIVIFNEKDNTGVYGKYDAITNTVFYCDKIANKSIRVGTQTEYHEMWHMKQAENFINKFGKITDSNYSEYIEFANKKAKKNLDELGVTEYNVNEISKYATRKYMFGRFDEVEAEYYALIKRG